MYVATCARRLPRRISHVATAVLTGSLSLSACAPGDHLSAVPAYDPDHYTLGVGDQVHVSTYGEDQLTGQFQIPVDGMIAFPIIGDVQAASKTSHELAEEISDAMRAHKILRKADVSVQITAYRAISVIGEVQHPGQFAYQPNMTLLTAVAAAGGFTYRAFQDYAYVVRQEPGTPVVGKLKPQDYVKPEDVIKVYERHF